MLKNKQTISMVFVKFIFVLLLGYFVLTTLSFPLFYREQQQLFLFDFDYVKSLLSEISGFSVLISRFLVQFFYNPIFAVIITVLLLTLVAYLTEKILYKLFSHLIVVFIAMIPSTILSVFLIDNCFFYQGLIAFILMLIAFDFYTGKISDPNDKKFFEGLVLILFVFYLAGPAALLLSVSIFVFDSLKYRKIFGLSIFYPIVILFVGWLVVRLGIVGAYSYIFTPKGYYEMTAPFSPYYQYCWFLFPVLLILVSLLYFFFDIKKLNFCGVFMTVLFVSITGFYLKKIFRVINNPTMNKFTEYEYYTVNEEWKKLNHSISFPIRNQNDANYLNLSLAMQGKLVDDLFEYPQFGPRSLIFIPNEHVRDERLAHLLFSMGNISAAQNIAFNACLSLSGYNPSMIKMITQIELMRGSYDVALKYIELLEQSFHYSVWATEQRKYLYNDALVEQDSVLSQGRKSFPDEEMFVLVESPMDDLYRIIKTNPDNKVAMDYALAYLLLAKDMNHIREFVDRYYGSSCLKRLPVPIQEALVFYSDYYHTLTIDYAENHGISLEQLKYHQTADMNYCLQHGVEKKTIDRFLLFKNLYGKNRDVSSFASYNKTFWYYMLFVQV